MNKKHKIELLTFWIQNSDKVGEIPPKLNEYITLEEVNDLTVQIGSLDKKDLIELRDELKKDVQEEKNKRKEKFELFKSWIYPILVPIITTVLIFFIMNNFVNPPDVLDISVMEFYNVPASSDVQLSFLITNQNSAKLVVHSLGYQFGWTDPNPIGQNFTPIETPRIYSINDTNINSKNNEIILNGAGQDGDSKIMTVVFKSPPESSNLYTFKIIADTDKGKIIKEVKLNSIRAIEKEQ